MTDLEEARRSADEIIEACRPLFAGRGPIVQGLALAQLTATWIAGHPPVVWIEILGQHVGAVAQLAPIERELMVSQMVERDPAVEIIP